MGNNSPTAIAKQKAIMLTALEANYGNVTKAAKLAKITTQTHYRWLKEDREYAVQAENLKDISFRNLKDTLLELCLDKARKGDAMVLNQMMRIFFKNTPEEMKMATYYNNVPIRATVKWITTPQDPKREGYVKPAE